MELYQDRKVASREVDMTALTVEERLKQRIIDGDRIGLDDDLAEAMREHAPLTIINTFLLDGMKVVGELFGSGQMQLPFVLQSAETMKAAVAWLEPHMEKSENDARGTMVIATVKGDVHDIGKNLVDIIVTNNGYRVINLGIKVPIDTMLEAVTEHNANVLGMSGLLVKSTLVMKENLQIMVDRGIDIPVVLGGAALNRRYVEGDLREIYGDALAYAEDAFDGLKVMDRLAAGEPIGGAASEQRAEPAGSTEIPDTQGASRGGAVAFAPLDDPTELEAILEISGGSWFAIDGEGEQVGRVALLDEVVVGGAVLRELPDGSALLDPVAMIPEQARTGGLKDLLHGTVGLARRDAKEREVYVAVDPDDRRRTLLFRSLGFQPIADDRREELTAGFGGLKSNGSGEPNLLRARPGIGAEAEEKSVEIPKRSDVALLDELPTPPFWGSRVVTNVDLDKVYQYINEVALFRGQWGVRKGDRTSEEYRREVDENIRPRYEELKLRMKRENLLTPKVIYGYFPVRAEGETITVYRPEGIEGEDLIGEWDLPSRENLDETTLVPWQRFTFPRQQEGRFLTLADFIRPADSEAGGFDILPVQIVTVGSEASRYAATLFEGGEYTDYLFTHGLSVETAEALAEYWHRSIRTELGIAGDDANDIRRLFSQGYRGSRYSFGYPACPDLEDQTQIFEMLRPERIGIELTEEFMLEPEQSTSAIVIHHPEAKYFSA